MFLPLPEGMNSIVIRLTAFTLIGLMAQKFLLKRAAISSRMDDGRLASAGDRDHGYERHSSNTMEPVT